MPLHITLPKPSPVQKDNATIAPTNSPTDLNLTSLTQLSRLLYILDNMLLNLARNLTTLPEEVPAFT